MLSGIISLYKNVQKEINRSYSGKGKFNSIINYFSECEKVFNSSPPFSLTKDFISTLLDVILKSDINFTDPSKLNAAKFILNNSKQDFLKSKSGEVVVSQIEKAVDILNMQMLKSYFYLGKYEDGIQVMNSMLTKKNLFYGKDETNAKASVPTPNKKTPSSRYALVNPDIFKESKAYEILSEIKNELEKLNTFSDSSINIMLVESSGHDDNWLSGTIQSLLVTTKFKNSRVNSVNFENITDLEDFALEQTLDSIGLAANTAVKNISGETITRGISRSMRFQNIKALYRGDSFGLGAAIISVCNYFNFANKRRRITVSNSAAFTGAINKDGIVTKVNTSSINNKIEAAFFSWIKYCFVPKENLNDAISVYEELKKKYPTKELDIIGVEKVTDVFLNERVFKREELSVKEFSKQFFERNKAISVVSLLIITSVLVFLLSLKFFPKDVKPLPVTQAEMSLIYAPDRDTAWTFINNNYFGGDTIDFGDAAIGDQWFPMIEFWNNARQKEEFSVFVDGRDKDEFQLTWLYKNEQPGVPNTFADGISQNLYVRFVPTKETGKKNALLIFENKRTKSRKEIYLKGESKRRGKGYCIKIEEPDDALVLEPNTSLLQNNFTISFWIKPYFIDKDSGLPILRVDNNPLSKNKFSINISGTDSLIEVNIYGSKSTEIPLTKKFTRLKPGFNEWNFLAFTVSDTTAAIILNDKYERFEIEKNALRKINDCIYFGTLHPSERSKFSKLLLECKYYLDEFRIFNKAYSPDELIKNRLNTEYGKDVLLAGFGFDDATPRRIFDESSNDFWPMLYGGVKRIIDSTQPFSKKIRTNIKDSNGNKVFKRSGKGFAKLNKEIYKNKSSFTLQCDMKSISKPPENDNGLFSLHKSILFPSPYFINRPDLDINFDFRYDSLFIRILNHYTKNHYFEYIKYSYNSEWNRFTISYDINLNEYNFYINNNLIKTLNSTDIQDITQNYMGISFALANYYGSPRFTSFESSIDNIKLFNRAINKNEIFAENNAGLIAYWTFEKTDNELAYDEISGLPLLMIEPFEIVNEEIERLPEIKTK